MEVVKYSFEYKNEVIALILEIQRCEFGLDINIEDQPDLDDIGAYYQKSSGNFWVALIDGKVVGTISLLYLGNGQAALRKMFVHKSFRGARYGVASRLLSALLSWAREQNLQELYLGTTNKFTAAQRFYVKNNFEEIVKNMLPSSFPVMKVDSKFYKYEI